MTDIMQFQITIGHEKQKQLFLRALGGNRLHHAYAFAGPEHVGKTTFALDLAQILGAKQAFDLFVYDNEQGLGIEEARQIQGKLSLTSLTSSYKVAVVAYAHRMSLEAANSLLKTLEEPPRGSLIILITSNFYQLPLTIISRIQKINFSRASHEQVRQGLREFNLSREKTDQIISLASGRIGAAKMLASSEESFGFSSRLRDFYQILENGNLISRLSTAQEIANLPSEQIRDFLNLACELWVERPEKLDLARRIQNADRDLEMNLNTKLFLDNLFLA